MPDGIRRSLAKTFVSTTVAPLTLKVDPFATPFKRDLRHERFSPRFASKGRSLRLRHDLKTPRFASFERATYATTEFRQDPHLGCRVTDVTSTESSRGVARAQT